MEPRTTITKMLVSYAPFPFTVTVTLSKMYMQDPLMFVLAAGIGTLLLVSLVVLRIYLVSTEGRLQHICWCGLLVKRLLAHPGIYRITVC
jgi:hypothetical protein